jgi:hypothetical protein
MLNYVSKFLPVAVVINKRKCTQSPKRLLWYTETSKQFNIASKIDEQTLTKYFTQLYSTEIEKKKMLG